MCFFLFWKGMDTFTLGMGRQLTSLQFAWPFYESDRTNQAGVPLRPCSMGHMYGKETSSILQKDLCSFWRVAFGRFSQLKGWQVESICTLTTGCPKSEELRGWEPRRICLSEGCSQCRLGIQVTMLGLTVLLFLGVFFVCFLNGFWLVVGGTLQKLDAKVPTSPGTKKVTCADSGPGDPPKTPICSSKS